VLDGSPEELRAQTFVVGDHRRVARARREVVIDPREANSRVDLVLWRR
jgi:hypothetical protein